jgi:hypothetical protein
MKRLAHYLVLIGILLPSVAGAVDVGVDATTLFRFEQQSVPLFAKQTIAPATQFIGVDMDKLGDGNLSFHLYGWGRADLADKSTNEGKTDGDLAYAYMKYRFPSANGLIRAGRFFVTEGVAIEQIDGVSARADICKNFGLSFFGGAPVKLDWNKKSKGEYIYGGRANLRLGGMLDLGVSALQEGHVVVNQLTGEKRNRDMLGGDVWFSPIRMLELTGHTFYNATTRGIAENSYLLTLKPVKTFTLTGEYNQNRFKDYFAFSSVPQIFNPNTGDKLESFGGSAAWKIIKPLEVIGDYRHYRRDSIGESDRYGAEARLSLMDNQVRSGVGFHRSRGAGDINSYDEARAYAMYRGQKYQGSLDGIVHVFDAAVNGKHNAFGLTASAGYRILPELVVSGDVGYGENPRQTSDFRGLIRVTYNFNSTSKGAKP